MSTLVLNLDDEVADHLSVLAKRSHKALPEWAAEQLAKMASASGDGSDAAYTAEWRSAFGAIKDPAFQAPDRRMPRSIESLSAES